MEEAYELANYMPASYKRVSDLEYVNFLWDSFQSNYEQEKYQFAYLGYHMIFMSFTYFNVWQIKNSLNPEFKNALALKDNIEKDFLEATSPFVFSQENERSIFGFLKLVDCPKDKIGKYKKLVDIRNEISHSNGNIYFKDAASFEIKIDEILRCAKEIQAFSKPVIEESYKTFLLESWDEEEREFSDPIDQIKEIFIHQHFLSHEDINFCLNYNIGIMRKAPFFKSMVELHTLFCNEYSED